MSNIQTYETIAREAGFELVQSQMRNGHWYWEDYWHCCDEVYATQEEAWKACCVENNLLEE